MATLLSSFVGKSATSWRNDHSEHHAHLGDTSVFDSSLTVVLNRQEYSDTPYIIRTAYRILRDPFIFPHITSILVFMIFPFLNHPFSLEILYRALFLVLLYCCGGHVYVINYVIALWLAGVIGVLIFHLQHQCNPSAYRVPHSVQTMLDAGLHGSTHLWVPAYFQWVTMGIECHHIHHASTLVPGYNLRACHDEAASIGVLKSAGVNFVGPKRMFLSLFHTLYLNNKMEEAGKPNPLFCSFEPYQSMGLWDSGLQTT
jgi:omega-6 fatty acid desaturase (delta-12 desaturase)